MKAFFTICFYLLISAMSFAQNWSIGKISSWIKPDSIDHATRLPANDIDGGYYYALIDEQVNAETKESYSHYVYRVENSAGVQNASELTFDFNPAFQALTLHSITVYRDGKALNKLIRSNLKTLQREPDFERHMFDNSMSVFTVLDDIRAGDVVDYSYTIKGENPIFADRFSYHFFLRTVYPLLKVNERIVYNKKRDLTISYHKETLKPTTTVSGNMVELLWSYTDVDKVKTEADLPVGYRSTPGIELSEFKDWSGVQAWASGVFRLPAMARPQLKKKAAEISAKIPGRNDRVIAALRFVQNQVRYYGFEIGVNAIKPHEPEVTLQKRFGDCKDKAVLYCELLREMGIDSCWPVLVHSGLRKEVATKLPSAKAFNHAIACVRLDGKDYFFDPTASFEGGDFEHTSTTNYGVGLVVSPLYKGLTPINPQQYNKSEFSEVLTMHSVKGEAELRVVSVYTGMAADIERYRFANSSLNEIKDSYESFYKRKFGPLNMNADPEVTDDSILNVFTVRESYNIDCVWDKSTVTPGYKSFDIGADEVNDYTQRYAKYEEGRKMPVGIDFPLHYVHDIEIHFPETWAIGSDADTYNSEWMNYTRRVDYNDRVMKYHTELKTLKGECAATDAWRVYQQLKKIGEHNWYVISHDSSLPSASKSVVPVSGSRTNILMVVIFFLAATILVFLTMWLYRRRGPAPLIMEEPLGPKGLGGWLVIVVIGFFAGGTFTFVHLFTNHYFNLDQWQSLVESGQSAYPGVWAFGILFELITLMCVVAIDVLCLVLFYKKDYRFPRYAIIRLVFIFAAGFIGLLIQVILRNELQPGVMASKGYALIGAMVALSIWLPYLLVSKRVKNTFVK